MAIYERVEKARNNVSNSCNSEHQMKWANVGSSLSRQPVAMKMYRSWCQSVRQVVASAGRKELHVMDDEPQQNSCRHGLHNHTWSCCWEQPAEHSNPDPMREESFSLSVSLFVVPLLLWDGSSLGTYSCISQVLSYLNLVIASNGKKLRK